MITSTSPPPGQEPFLRINQVASYLSTPIPTVREWARSGKLPYYKPGKAFLFRMSDVTAFMTLYRRRSDADLKEAVAAKHQELNTSPTNLNRS